MMTNPCRDKDPQKEWPTSASEAGYTIFCPLIFHPGFNIHSKSLELETFITALSRETGLLFGAACNQVGGVFNESH